MFILIVISELITMYSVVIFIYYTKDYRSVTLEEHIDSLLDRWDTEGIVHLANAQLSSLETAQDATSKEQTAYMIQGNT
jgi:hypothetical protein